MILNQLRVNIEQLILGCTHYPIMARTIQSAIPNDVDLIYSGETVGQYLHDYLLKNNF